MKKINEEITVSCNTPINELFTKEQQVLLYKWFKYLNEELPLEYKIIKGTDEVISNHKNNTTSFLPINTRNIIN